MRVEKVELNEIIDSETYPAIEVKINDAKGKSTTSFSRTEFEADSHIPDHLKDLEKVLEEKLTGRDLTQSQFDKELKRIDGSENFSRLGAVAEAASIAFKKSSGFKNTETFPLPISKILGTENNCKKLIDQFLVIPVNSDGLLEAVRTNTAIYQEIKNEHRNIFEGRNNEDVLKTCKNTEKTLKKIKEVAERHEARIGFKINTENIFEDGKYYVKQEDQKYNTGQYILYLQELIDEFEPAYIEDPFPKNNFKQFARIRTKNPDIIVAGNKIFKTNKERIEKGIRKGAANAAVTQPGQAGTVTQLKNSIKLCKEFDIQTIISNKKTETEEQFNSKIALEENIKYIKTNIRGISTNKLNSLITDWKKSENPKLQKN